MASGIILVCSRWTQLVKRARLRTFSPVSVVPVTLYMSLLWHYLSYVKEGFLLSFLKEASRVVPSMICHFCEFDWFLCSHFGIQVKVTCRTNKEVRCFCVADACRFTSYYLLLSNLLLRQVQPYCLHPGTCLLCIPCGLSSTTSSGGSRHMSVYPLVKTSAQWRSIVRLVSFVTFNVPRKTGTISSGDSGHRLDLTQLQLNQGVDVTSLSF